ncbi:MAG: IS66 family transposase [Betaproteobacteria bacterium]|nr:IS66 family transposase [Betaproteobacteria bacterium]
MKNEVTMDSLIIENAVLRAELSEVKGKLAYFMELLSSSRRKQFGVSSEKSIYDGIFAQPELFPNNQTEVHVFGSEAADEAPPAPKNKPIKKGEMNTRLSAGLPIETVECVLPDDEQGCPQCGEQMHVIGKEIVRRELKFTPAEATIIEYVRYTYGCRPCERAETEAQLVKAPMPPQLIKGSMCAPETVAHIAAEKCVMGAPLYRQEQDWRRKGIPITRQTMASWLIRCSEDYLEPIYEELHRRMLLGDLLHSDDTIFQVLREPGKPAQSESRMWLYRTSCDVEHPIVLYDYQPDRSKERPREFLAGFSGYLLTDGYTAYHTLPENIVVVGCLAHVRSKFTDALKCLKEAERPGSLALEGKKYCDHLFDLERDIKDEPFSERFKLRNEKASPILNEFRIWLDAVSPHISSKSKLGTAVGYAMNQWKYVIRYLLDGRIECSNNRGERSIKPFVINRKNFLFADSVAGARAAAVLHSMTETAKESSLDPYEYLSYVFRNARASNIRGDADLLEKLLPENAPQSCRARLDARK